MNKILKELSGENNKGYLMVSMMFVVMFGGLLAYVVRDPWGVAMLIYPAGFVLTSILSVQKPIVTHKITALAIVCQLLALAIFA